MHKPNIQCLKKICRMIPNLSNHRLVIRIVIPRFSRGIEEFYDKEFLTRKTDEENEELTGLKKSFFRKKN